MGSDIKDPLELPCGLVLPNRLVKAAMAEGMAESGRLPGTPIFRKHEKWAKRGWGALLIGRRILNDSEASAIWLHVSIKESPRGVSDRGILDKPIAPSEIALYIGNRLVTTIIQKAVPKTFYVKIKLNSADHSRVAFEDTLTQISLFSKAGIDFLEISSGTYEDLTIIGRGLRDETTNSQSLATESREAFFLDFRTQIRKRFPNLILIVTGGFRTRKGIETALKRGVCDLVVIGRPAVLNPNFPQLMMDDAYSDKKAQVVFFKVQIPLLVTLLKIRMWEEAQKHNDSGLKSIA
ncbi:uncharacterized protein N7496_000283 [Penicillium cataractarum]|uniref:NADH:flavin oxidoreductase/NADH oxidase N-terminal domain-containing protein n=1 Tax=Penicillium cataractarum TaxID=2100454 RepID=A0A9W9VU39_9EURO|nr:uncharacterized protein N7496_000283 [Penicillium cataractarum]KAJ5389215.1 hypothetical protein N7496_000283 [Penicillium cataractarum]